jgi:hypothetical protein
MTEESTMTQAAQFLNDLLQAPPTVQPGANLNFAWLGDLAQARGYTLTEDDIQSALLVDATLTPRLLALALAHGVSFESSEADELTAAELDLVVGGGNRGGCMTQDCTPQHSVWTPGGTEVVGQWQWLKL